MNIGRGCRVHLKTDELPAGRLIVPCSKHTTAVIDGVIHDTYDPSRHETRCVYGYFIKGTGARQFGVKAKSLNDIRYTTYSK
jgi:hypothetical protein